MRPRDTSDPHDGGGRPPAPQGPPARTAGAAPDLPALLLPVALGCLLLLASPSLSAAVWAPRAAVLLVLTGCGLPVLVRGARRGDLASRLALAWVGWAALATALSPTPRLATFGLYNWGTGLLFVAGLGACFSLAATAGATTRRRAWTALVVAAGANAVLALGQMAELVTTPPFDAVNSAEGAMGNSSHLAALLVAALVGVIVLDRWRWWAQLGFALLLCTAIQGSGSRLGLLLAGGAVAGLVVLRRWRGAALVAAALAAGLVLGALVPPEAAGTGTARLAASSNAVAVRRAAVTTGLRAFGDRPLLGHGPGTFRAATLPERTVQEAADQAPEHLVDAHDLVVEHLATTGLPGAILLVAFLALALWRARGPWRWVAGIVLAVHLVEPQSVVLTPLVFLAVGFAQPERERALLPSHVGARVARAVPALVGVVAAVALVVGDAALHRATFDLDVRQAARADRWLPVGWAKPAAARARAHAFDYESGHAPAEARAAVRWYREAAEREPDDPALWSSLARFEQYLGDTAAAEAHFRRAVAADPGAVDALVALGRLVEASDPAEAGDRYRTALAIRPRLPATVAALRRVCAASPPCPPAP